MFILSRRFTVYKNISKDTTRPPPLNSRTEEKEFDDANFWRDVDELKVVGKGADFFDANVEEFAQEGVLIVQVFLAGVFSRLQGHTYKYTYSAVTL
jgi:hypothetical protein